MTHPAAATLSIQSPPRLALECLRALRSVLDGLLSGSADDPPAAARANDSEPLERTTGKATPTRSTREAVASSSAGRQRKR
jgi:hypothetical protein